MKKQRHFRALVAPILVLMIAFLIWAKGELPALQIYCLVALILVGGMALVNNQRNETVNRAASISALGAMLILIWSNVLTLRGAIGRLIASIIFIWLSLAPYISGPRKSGNSGVPEDPQVEP